VGQSRHDEDFHCARVVRPSIDSCEKKMLEMGNMIEAMRFDLAICECECEAFFKSFKVFSHDFLKAPLLDFADLLFIYTCA